MTEIFIDPVKTNISIQVKSQSLHTVGFQITVFGSDGSTIIEQFTGDTKTNPFNKPLQNSPASYKGRYIRGTFTVNSPNGTDYPYSILFSILEDSIIVLPNNTLAGTTTGGSDTSISQYHLN